jgi:hypothetical protein
MMPGCQVVRYMTRYRTLIKCHQGEAFLFRERQHVGIESTLRRNVGTNANLSKVDGGFNGLEGLTDRCGNLLVE